MLYAEIVRSALSADLARAALDRVALLAAAVPAVTPAEGAKALPGYAAPLGGGALGGPSGASLAAPAHLRADRGEPDEAV